MFGKQASKARKLSQNIVVGVAVDLNARSLRFATDGEWDEDAAFGPADIPEGTALFPAVSCKGRAAFIFGPTEFKYAPPDANQGGKFLQWPSTPGGLVRIDSPDLGNSEVLSVYKEVQIHGEINLRRHVQRLVANNKYRLKPKTERSLAVLMSNAGACSGTYHRVGAHEGKPLYRSEAGAVIFWDAAAKLWKVNQTQDFTTSFGQAPADDTSPGEPPPQGWRLPDEARGVMEREAFEATLEELGLAKKDITSLLAALTDTPGKLVYRVKGERSLVQEWAKLKEPPTTCEAAWEAAVKSLQQRVLKEAASTLGYPELPQVAQIVETKHPYDAARYSWTREVLFKDALALNVYFASKSCTLDHRTRLTIAAGGFIKSAVGPGARVEVALDAGGSKVQGTLVGTQANFWRVRLDRVEPALAAGGEAAEEAEAAEVSWPPAEGDPIDAKRSGGDWARAKVSHILYSWDWYTGFREPALYEVTWLDGSKEDCDKQPDEIRRREDLGDHATYGAVPPGDVECFALCSEAPRAVFVKYGDQRVGAEIGAFALNADCPLAPISVGELAESGPAQEQGVSQGWYLDLAGTVLGESRSAMSTLLDGVGNVKLPPKDAHIKGGRLNNRMMTKLLNAAYCNLEEVVKRLNEGLRDMTKVTLLFKSGLQGRILPEVHVRYEGKQPVGSEIQMFTTEDMSPAKKAAPAHPTFPTWYSFGAPKPPKTIRAQGFLKVGPAQSAGVRSDWILDVAKTRELNPSREEVMSDDVLCENPNVLLGMTNVTLAFKQPNTQRVPVFEGSGPPDSEVWKCYELPGDAAEFHFSTDGDGMHDAGRRWGFWALALPAGAPRLSAQGVNNLADKWVEVSMKAMGIEKTPTCERDEWDEQRLRALCARHGWEFEWMTEDGERRRRASERQGFFLASGQLAGAREAAEARAAALTAQHEAAAAEAVPEPAPA